MVFISPRVIWYAVTLIGLAAGAFFLYFQVLQPDEELPRIKDQRPVPVQVAEVYHGPLSLWRTFSGTIEPKSKFTVAPKINGRIQILHVDVSDQVDRGQAVAQLEDAEFKQAVLEAEARLAVTEANRTEAVSQLEINQRELNRTKTLFDRGIASESAYDIAQAAFLTSQAAVKIASANLKREQAQLRAARIRLGYTTIEAEWQQGDSRRTVAERFVDEGNTVAANTPLITIVELDPVIAAIQVTEKDYPLITIGQQAKVYTDAYPNRVFVGSVSRISPIFRESSRQARMELRVANPDHLLKPGMFSRCTLELQKIDKGAAVYEMAVTERNDQSGVFKIAEDDVTVTWVPVKTGFASGEHIQIVEPKLTGRVVMLGQQFLQDGSSVRIIEETPPVAGGGSSK